MVKLSTRLMSAFQQFIAVLYTDLAFESCYIQATKKLLYNQTSDGNEYTTVKSYYTIRHR